jgi:hypothetical protein
MHLIDDIAYVGFGTRRERPSGEVRQVGVFEDRPIRYSTVTLLARLRGWSTSVPFKTATW